MSFMSSEQLALMREQQQMMLPDTCVIKTPSYVSDGGGGQRITYTASGTVQCRLDPPDFTRADQVMKVAEGEKMELARRLYLPYDTVLDGGYQFTVTNAYTGIVNTYELVDRMDNHSWNVSVIAIVKEID